MYILEGSDICTVDQKRLEGDFSRRNRETSTRSHLRTSARQTRRCQSPFSKRQEMLE